jgi:hypothetical protein
VELGSLGAAEVKAPVGVKDGGEAVDSCGGVKGREVPGRCSRWWWRRKGEGGECGGWVDGEGYGGGGEVHVCGKVGELWVSCGVSCGVVSLEYLSDSTR